MAHARYDRSTMAVLVLRLSEYPWEERYRVPDFEQVLTPALVIYPALIASNIGRTLALLNGDTDRWRVHIKTAKLGFTVHMLRDGRVAAVEKVSARGREGPLLQQSDWFDENWRPAVSQKA